MSVFDNRQSQTGLPWVVTTVLAVEDVLLRFLAPGPRRMISSGLLAGWGVAGRPLSVVFVGDVLPPGSFLRLVVRVIGELRRRLLVILMRGENLCQHRTLSSKILRTSEGKNTIDVFR